MKLEEYLQNVVRTRAYEYRAWWFSVFSVLPNSSLTDAVGYKTPWIGYKENDKYYVVDDNNNPVAIEFGGDTILDNKIKIKVDSSLYPDIEKAVNTTIGNLLANLILIYSIAGSKIPFQIPPYTIRSLEDIYKDKMVEDDKAKETDVKLSEYVDFVDATSFLRGLSSLFVQSSSKKTITPPPDIDKKREELLKKYEGRLDDYKVIAAIEKELLEYDKQYLSDDPTSGKFMSGKVANVARKRMFLTFGAEPNADNPTKASYVAKSLEEGWSTEPEELAAMFNSFRSGAYQRAKHTEKGGVLFKMFARSMNVYKILDGDCGSKKGIKWTVSSKDRNILVGRYIVYSNGKTELIDKILFDKLVGRTIQIRSPLYCLKEKKRFCSTCAGEKMATKPEGVSLSVMEISEAVTTAALKAMHGKVLQSREVDISDIS